jgi:protein-tyrosine phosphatase
MAHALPAARGAGYRIAVVCSGNICRSPVADIVLTDKIAEAGLPGITVDSFGTGGWHVGEGIDHRSGSSLVAAGYDGSRHRARQFGPGLASDYDLVLAMDAGHFAQLSSLGVAPDRLSMFRSWDPEPGDGDVPDPFYGGPSGFTDVLVMIERTAERIVADLEAMEEARLS